MISVRIKQFEWHGVWIEVKANLEGEEILGLVSGIMNSYRDVAVARRQPRLGNYLMDGSPLCRMRRAASLSTLDAAC